MNVKPTPTRPEHQALASLHPKLVPLLTTAQFKAYQSGDAHKIRQADDAALQEAIKTSLLEEATSTLVRAALLRGADRVVQSGHDRGAQKHADSASSMDAHERARINEQVVFSGSAKANATKMDAWLESHRIRALNVSGEDNNCLLRCLAAAHSPSGTDVDELLVAKLSSRARGNEAPGPMLVLGEKAADEALAVVNEERVRENLKPFRWVEIQPGHDGPQVIAHTDEDPSAYVPLPVRIDKNHFQLLIHDPDLQAHGPDPIQRRREEINKEVADNERMKLDTGPEDPSQKEIHQVCNDEIARLRQELEALDVPWT